MHVSSVSSQFSHLLVALLSIDQRTQHLACCRSINGRIGRITVDRLVGSTHACFPIHFLSRQLYIFPFFSCAFAERAGLQLRKAQQHGDAWTVVVMLTRNPKRRGAVGGWQTDIERDSEWVSVVMMGMRIGDRFWPSVAHQERWTWMEKISI